MAIRSEQHISFKMCLEGRDRDFHFKHVEIYKGEDNCLGIGSYGAVYKAKCDDLPCAAKILHPVLFQSNDPGAFKVLQRFKQECEFMNEIRHPNIVLYLGVCQDQESNLPVLLMELLDESLTKFLHRSKSHKLFHIQLDICYDIAIALSYLHANRIIHRDLSSNNILLTAGRRAKVADFGMSKLIHVSRVSLAIQSAATFCPGTEVYMSPEAVKQPPVYTEKLDCFSFGVLVIQVLSGLFPNPGPRTREVEFIDSPTGTIEVPILETERRSGHIQLVDPANPLLSIAINCLNYNYNERPAAADICKCLSSIQTTSEYFLSKDNVSSNKTALNTVEELQIENASLKLDLRMVKEQLTNQEIMLSEKEQALKVKDGELQALQTQFQIELSELQNQDHSLKKLELVKVHNQHDQLETKGEDVESTSMRTNQLVSNKSITSKQKADLGELQQRLDDTERELHGVRQMLVKREMEIIDQHQRNSPRSALRASREAKAVNTDAQVRVITESNGKAPCKVARGSSAVSGSTIYLRPAGSSEVYAYNIRCSYWFELPQCPLSGFTLVVVGNTLTAIGVNESDSCNVNVLLSYLASRNESKDSDQRKWSEELPPMLTKRYNPAAVYTEQILVVAGGNVESGEKVNAVEVMNTEKHKWYTTSELPIPISQASAVVCKDMVYLIGGVDNGRKWVNSVMTCSIYNLHEHVSEKTRQRSKGKLHFSHSRSKPKSVSSEWHLIANLPVGRATCTCISNMLLAVGGISLSSTQATGSIHMYNVEDDYWEIVGHLTTPRSQCLVASQEKEAVVIGGWLHNDSTMTEDIELIQCISHV